MFSSTAAAKMALRRIHFGIADQGVREVVHADLSDYFNIILQGDLMGCVAQRINDGTVRFLAQIYTNTQCHWVIMRAYLYLPNARVRE